MNEAFVVMVRGIISFFTLLIFTRILGKEQISQLTFFEYIMGITIGSTASSLTTDLSTSAWSHWVGLATWTILVFLMQWITLKSRYMSKYLGGEPTVVIMNGQLMDAAMKKMRYRLSDLLEQLREKDVFDIAQVAFAVVETDGKLSVLKKSEYQPLTPRDMNIPTKPAGLSIELIYDGVIVKQNLDQIHKSPEWLMAQLKAQGIKDGSEVFLASINPLGELYIDKYQDNAKNIIDPSDYKGPN